MQHLRTLAFGLLTLTLPLLAVAEDFLSDPASLRGDERFGGDLVYFSDNILERLVAYESVMVDEPVIFIAADSPYNGFKASDIAAVAEMMRQSIIQGLTTQPVSFGHFQAVDQPGAATLYVRLALKNVYIRKNKRGLLAYTPVGAVVKGASDLAREAIDKSTLVEMAVEAEMQDSVSGEVLFAIAMDRGQRADKSANVKEEAAEWEATGNIAQALGRRLACRLDNARLAEDQRKDCIAEIPIEL